MNLLLTSSGITNSSIEKTFLELIGKKPEDIVNRFIPTAACVEDDISWLDEDIENIKNVGVRDIRMVDISKLKKDKWLSELEQSDVIWMNGGNTYYLLDWVRKSGLKDELPALLKERLYVGSSAGSIIVGPDLSINDLFPEEQEYKLEDITGLNYVSFSVLPHLNSPFFKEPTKEAAKNFAQTLPYPLFAIDDQTAIRVRGDNIDFITEGEYLTFNYN